MLILDIVILILVIMLIPISNILTVIIFIVVIAIQWWVVDGYEQQGVARQMGLSAK